MANVRDVAPLRGNLRKQVDGLLQAQVRGMGNQAYRAEHQHINAPQTLNLAGVDVADVGDVGQRPNAEAHDGHGAMHHA